MDFLANAMCVALDEARQSLREGNHGFGAAILSEERIIAQAHDEEETQHDCTSHAEINAIKKASRIYGKDLSGCTMISTHEPCPMCAAAIVWSGISEIAFGYSIEESIEQGRKRIALRCEDIFASAGKDIKVVPGILYDECKVLYLKNVRSEVKRLRGATEEILKKYNEVSKNKRLEWFEANKGNFDFLKSDKLDSAYKLLLCRLGIDPEEAPIVRKSNQQVVFHSRNFCPTLEACKILNLDTRYICRRYNEESTDSLIKQIDSHLWFSRNYEKLRPYAEYCEEYINIAEE